MLNFKQFSALFPIAIVILGSGERLRNFEPENIDMFRVCASDDSQTLTDHRHLLLVRKNGKFRPPADAHRTGKALENEMNQLTVGPDFKRLVLVQSWPRAACAFFNSNDTQKFKEFCMPCGIDKRCSNDNWSWHGLWPSNNPKEERLEYCTSEKFDENLFETELKDYKDLMERKWRGIKHYQFQEYTSAPFNKTYKNFWKYQWEKHGTCYGRSQAEYFRTAIELFQKFDLAKVLDGNFINPDLDADKIFLKIHDAIKSYPEMERHAAKIICKDNRDHLNQEVTLIHEVHICFSSDLEVEDCPSVYYSANKCNVGDVNYY